MIIWKIIALKPVSKHLLCSPLDARFVLSTKHCRWWDQGPFLWIKEINLESVENASSNFSNRSYQSIIELDLRWKKPDRSPFLYVILESLWLLWYGSRFYLLPFLPICTTTSPPGAHSSKYSPNILKRPILTSRRQTHPRFDAATLAKTITTNGFSCDSGASVPGSDAHSKNPSDKSGNKKFYDSMWVNRRAPSNHGRWKLWNKCFNRNVNQTCTVPEYLISIWNSNTYG